jgi:hypothetical protein
MTVIDWNSCIVPWRCEVCGEPGEVIISGPDMQDRRTRIAVLIADVLCLKCRDAAYEPHWPFK